MRNGATLTANSRLPRFDITELVQNLPGAAYRARWDGTWTMDFLSAGCHRVTGYAPETIVSGSVSWQELVHPKDFSLVAAEITLASHQEHPFQVVYRIFTEEGAERWVMDEGRVVSQPEHGPMVLEGFISDVTTRKHTEMSLREANETIGRLIREDPLTGLANRRALEDNMIRAMAFTRRWGHPLSIVIADIDEFKVINDRYGHLTGDEVLVSFSRLLKTSSRTEDIVARFGGEEFILLIPNTDLDQAKMLAERLRRDTEAATMPIPAHITASFGVTRLIAEDTKDSLIARADRALYQAKQAGRNAVRCL